MTEKEKFMEIAGALFDSRYGLDLTILRNRLNKYGPIAKVKIAGILKACSVAIDCQLTSCDHNSIEFIYPYKKQCKDCGRTSHGDKIDNNTMFGPKYKWGKWRLPL